MWDYIVNLITDLVFLVPVATARFRRRHPGVPILVAGSTKACETYTRVVERGPHWIAARRGTLIATPSALFCGDWQIPLERVQSADLVYIRGGQVLVVACKDGPVYQFGLGPGSAWEKRLPLVLNVTRGKAGWSLFSILVRVWLVVMLLFTLWAAFSKE